MIEYEHKHYFTLKCPNYLNPTTLKTQHCDNNIQRPTSVFFSNLGNIHVKTSTILIYPIIPFHVAGTRVQHCPVPVP